MLPDIEIARKSKVKPIMDIARAAGIMDRFVEPHGKAAAKIDLKIRAHLTKKPNGKLFWVTAITPTLAGEGKTVTTIGLVQAFGRMGKKVMGCLRQPSMGPVFGLKGGATGGGYSQVYPMWDINLHFTGDIHAVGSAHNLLSAIVENHLARKNELGIDPTKILLRKVMDMNARELRKIVVGLGGRTAGGVTHDSGFDITAASEISAILALSRDTAELKEMMGKIVVAYTHGGKPITAGQFGCVGAMAALLKDAIKPNLVSTLEGQPVFIHGFPFANIAHGNSSIIATELALKLSEIVITEAGFAADLGLEKAFDIVCRKSGLRPDGVVVVSSVRALKMHGGAQKDAIDKPDAAALEKGFENLDRHLQIVARFGIPAVVAVNRFPSDSDLEIAAVRAHCEKMGTVVAVSTAFTEGGRGAVNLARALLGLSETRPGNFQLLYDEKRPVKEKIRIIATEIYGAGELAYSSQAEADIRSIEESGHGQLPVCMAKTQLSVTDNPDVKGAPSGWTLSVREVRLSAGAGFIVPLTGEIMTIPGLPANPAALKIDVDENGKITGLN